MRLGRITAIGSWVCLIAALILTPVALASTRPVLGLPAFWPVSVALALAAGFFTALRFSGPARIRIPWIAPACVAGLAALAILQSVPLPRGVVEKLAPARAAEDLAALDGLAAPSPALAISVAPGLTAGFGWKLLGWTVVLVVTAAIARRRAQVRFVLLLLVALCTAEALFGLLAHFARWNPFDFPDTSRATGTFANPNNFAALLSLGLFAALGLSFEAFRRLKIPDYASWKARVTSAADDPGFWKALLLAGAAVVIATGLFFSLSRGAILAAAAGFVVFTLLVVRERGRWLVIPALVVIVGFGMILGLDPVEQRLSVSLSELSGDLGRPQFWTMAVAILEANPALGAGLGAFSRSSSPFWPPQHSGVMALYTHDDYLDVAAGGGVVGALLLIGAMLAIAVAGWRRHARRPRPLLACLLAALFASAVHALVDFPWQIPGVAIWVAALAGLVLAPAFGRGSTSRAIPALLVIAPVAAAIAWLSPEAKVSTSAEAQLSRDPYDAAPLLDLALESGDDAWFVRARRRGPSREVLEEARKHWLERVRTAPNAVIIDELATTSGPVLWSGIVPSKQLLRETLEATRNVDFLDRLVPPEGNPARAGWMKVIEQFKADSIK